MGKLHFLLSASELKRLSPQQKKRLQVQLTREVRKDQMAAAIIGAYRKMAKILKRKLRSAR